MKPRRCSDCEFSRTVSSNGGWSFIGCRHSPYRGKWVTEIEECPLTECEAKDLEDRIAQRTKAAATELW